MRIFPHICGDLDHRSQVGMNFCCMEEGVQQWCKPNDFTICNLTANYPDRKCRDCGNVPHGEAINDGHEYCCDDELQGNGTKSENPSLNTAWSYAGCVDRGHSSFPSFHTAKYFCDNSTDPLMPTCELCGTGEKDFRVGGESFFYLFPLAPLLTTRFNSVISSPQI